MNAKSKFKTERITGQLSRVSFPQVFKPVLALNKVDYIFSIVMLYAKTPTEKLAKYQNLAELQSKIAEVAADRFGPNWKNIPNFKYPLRDGAEKAEFEGYPESFFMTATCKADKHRPRVVDASYQPLSESDLYPGCYAYVSFSLYSFDTAGNRGVGVGLQNIMKVADGKKFGINSTPETDFKDVKVGDDLNAEFDAILTEDGSDAPF